MKHISNFYRSALLILIIFSINNSGLKAQEKIVFDKIIDWAWSPRTELWYGANSYYWWHREDVNPNILNYGELPNDNWESPYDYRNGTFWLRFEVLKQPTSNAFSVQFGIWQDINRPGGWLETCSSLAYLSGGAGSSVQKSIGSPANWWQINKEVKVDFTRPEDFYRIGILLWKGAGSCIPYAQGWSASSSQCADAEVEAAKFFPMEARLTIVAVASGYTFSGWEKYPGSGSTPPSSGIQGPYGGTTRNIPGTIQIEDYDTGGEGVAYHDNDATNNGGGYRTSEGVDIPSAPYDGSHIVGWFNKDEWMKYTVNIEPGNYDISIRVANPNNGRQLKVYLDNSLLTTLNVPNTGSYNTWQTSTVTNISIPGGTGKVLKLENVNGDFDFNWIQFLKNSSTSVSWLEELDTLPVVYPNPFNNILLLDNTEHITRAELINLNGETLIIKQNTQASEIKINTKNLKNGVYILRLSDDTGTVSVYKVLKSNE